MIEYKDLSDEQKTSFEYMTNFIASKDNQMVLMGYAGTGKTFLMKFFLDHIEKKTKYAITCTAPTNEAVRVIAKMTGRKYSDTIYSLLGLALIQEDDKEAILVPQGKGKVNEFDIIIIDEASMIHGELFDLIQAQLTKFTYIKVIYVGDTAQLPPVKDPLKISKAFLLPTQTHLIMVQRCAADNPIIAMVTAIRNNLDTKYDQFERITQHIDEESGVVFHDNRDEFMRLMFDAFKSDEYQQDNNFVRAIAYTNKAVNAINIHIRREIFNKKKPDEYEVGENLIVGEPIIKKYGRFSEIVYNVGERIRPSIVSLDKDDEFGFRYWKMKVVNYEADEDDKVVMTIKVIHEDDLKYYYGTLAELASEAKTRMRQTHKVKGVEVNVYSKGEAWSNYFDFKNVWSWVKYSYATTTHKAQGGTFKNIFVVERDLNILTWDDIERNKLKYVAFTRASHLLRILQ